MNSSIRRTILAVIISTFCVETLAKVAPDYIEICPGLKSECLKDNIQRTIPHFVKGIPSLGINSTDPLYLDYLKYDLPGGLNIEFFDGVLTGPRKCVVDSVKYENMQADLKLHCDLVIKGKYKANGKILLFVLDGEGDAKVKARNVIVDVKMIFEDKVRKGVEHREMKSIKSDYSFGDRVSFHFTNLFKGNPELSKTILDFLNENWQQVIDEFARPMVDPVLLKTLEVLKTFFKKIPKNELILE